MSDQRLLIIGNPEPVHIGHHLHYAAREIGLESKLCDVRDANRGLFVVRQLNWRLRGHRPARLEAFSCKVLDVVQVYRPTVVIVTGINPPTAEVVKAIVDAGCYCVNYLTDDPWNPAHHAPWFLDALPEYTAVFTPRRSNIRDLEQLGCRVSYLPFAYSPEIHFPELPPPERTREFDCDVLFYGGADRDRVPYIESLLAAGLNVHLYGGYWDRFSTTRSAARGMASPQILRWAVSAARITLCLVRHANRDGHTMRTFEAAAMGGCLLVEDTVEHRQIFGADMDHTNFFCNPSDMLERAKQLLAEQTRAKKLRHSIQVLITTEKNRYADRVMRIISEIGIH